MDKSKIDMLCNYLDENIARHYPIPNAELADSTDYLKNGYLKMLAVVMQQAGNSSEAQLAFFKRIIEGAKADDKAEDYLRKALDIEIADYVDFCEECKNSGLKYRWVLDAIILACIKERPDEQISLIAQFCESYEISRKELQYIATMARAIVSMDTSDYVTAYEIKEDTIPDSVFDEYLHLISKSSVYFNEHMTLFQPIQREDITIQALEKIGEINTPCVEIIGAEVSLNSYDFSFQYKEKVIIRECSFTESNKAPIHFTNCNQVIIEACSFTGGNKEPIRFTNCNQVVVRNSTFTDFDTRTLIIDESSTVLIDGCEFMNCMFKRNERNHDLRNLPKLGGVIFSSHPYQIGKLDIINSSFTKCGGIQESTSFDTAFISNIESCVDKCQFVNCWDYRLDWNNNLSESGDQHQKMFTEDSSATNCSYDNSASFC